MRLTILFALLLAACQPLDAPPPGFGEAVRHNMKVQMVNPATTAAAEEPGNDGARAGRAMQRYQEFKVFPPVSPVSATAEQK